MARLKGSAPRSYSLLSILVALLVIAFVLGWLNIPIVSSEGMLIRSQLISGEIPTTPDDPAWGKVPTIVLPLSGQVITRPAWPEPSARSLSLRSVHNGTDLAFLLE